MLSYYSLYCSLIICMIGLSIADNVDSQQVRGLSTIDKQKQKQKELLKEGEHPKQTDQSKQTEQPNDTSTSKCKPNEILTAKKGCVDHEAHVQHILTHSWVDVNLDGAKDKAGLQRTVECTGGEILTTFGCDPEKRPLRTSEWERPTVLHNHLYGNKVVKSSDGMPDMDRSIEASDNILASSNTKYIGITGSRAPLSKESRKKNLDSGDNLISEHTVGHNRPHSYIFLPGRKLQSQRKCRPYEVLGRNSRCIRKRGKSGMYEHADHQYGLQLRHRHEAFKTTTKLSSEYR